MCIEFPEKTERGLIALPDKAKADNSGQQKDLFSRYRDESRGAVLILVALLLVPLMALIGFAFESALAESVRVRLQSTTDSASLAAADLEQTLDPELVVQDFFGKAGLADNLDNVTVVDSLAERTVTIDASDQFASYLSRIIGWENWDVSVVGAATESRQDIEIALALDNSGSMSWAPGAISGPPATPSRMDLLIPAAQAFVDEVQPDPGQPGNTVISLVPFATQVSVGEALLSNFTVSAEHSDSNCVTFSDNADYQTTVIPTDTQLTRTAHHDARGLGDDVDQFGVVCPTDSAVRDIVPWSQNPDALKARIRAMQPYGFTSIEMATKWGAAMLDPSLRPVLSSLSGTAGFEYLSGPASRGVPDDYTSVESVKYLIVMSDGENTSSYDIRAPFRSGNSPVFHRPGTDNFAYFRNRFGPFDYYRVPGNFWSTSPGTGAVRLTWQEVWAELPVRTFVNDILSRADTSRTANGHYNRIVASTFNDTKNTRTTNICDTVKATGVTIFTIGMDTYGQGDATLLDCASSPSFFYDVNSLDIDSAFDSIAREINRLRLTQ